MWSSSSDEESQFSDSYSSEEEHMPIVQTEKNYNTFKKTNYNENAPQSIVYLSLGVTIVIIFSIYKYLG